MVNVARCALRWTIRVPLTGAAWVDDVVTTWHIQKSVSADPFSETELELVASAVHVWWESDLFSRLAGKEFWSQYTYPIDVAVQRVAPTISDAFLDTEAFANGERSGAVPFPPQCAHGVGLRCLETDRSARGRIYWPTLGGAESIGASVTGALDNSWRDDVAETTADLARNLYHALGAGEAVLAVYSRTHGTTHPVTHFAVPNVLLTQRRRAKRPLTYRNYGLDGALE